MLAVREKNMRVAREAQREDGAAWWDVEKRRRESRAYVEAAIRRVATRNMSFQTAWQGLSAGRRMRVGQALPVGRK